ncbi:GntR family transcriptional regulator [Streptomyces wedmorensis]
MPNHWSSVGLDLHLEVDAAGRRRLGLESALREAIRSRRLASGTRLPSTRALATELGISRGMVTAAYSQLTEKGYLTTRPGSGTSVADMPTCRPQARSRRIPSPRLPFPVTTCAPGFPM